MGKYKDAWARLYGYVNTKELNARIDFSAFGLPRDEVVVLTYADVVAYMEVVTAEYELVSETSPNRKR